MADFRPFRGIRYNPRSAGPLDSLICPPYDVISPSLEEELISRNQYNMVRLELAESDDYENPDRYSSAANYYRHWLKEQILIRDKEPGYYLLRHEFTFQGNVLERYGLLGSLKLEALGSGVLPHENTAPGPKQDRLSLMQACQANFSPIMGLVEDEKGIFKSMRAQVLKSPPDAQFKDSEGHDCSLWRIVDPIQISAIQQSLQSQPIYIADGHHRYETAIAYREQSGDSAADYVMMSLTTFDDSGLLLLPYHRILKELPPPLFVQVRDRIQQLFFTQKTEMDLSSYDPIERLLAKEGANHPTVILVGPGGEGPFLLTVGNNELVERYLEDQPVTSLKDIDSWLLESIVLNPVMGTELPKYVDYIHDGQDALNKVLSRQAHMALFLRAVPMDLFQQIVGAGIRLPRKSTYFYPKLPSGIVINSLSSV